MSKARKARAGTQRRRNIHHAALASARLSSGCICDPDLTIRHDADGQRINIAHDDWCPAVDAPSRTLLLIETTR